MLIVTNNPNVAERHGNVRDVEGAPLDVMNEVCALLGQSFRLMTAPLAGNLVMLRNPYRSVIMEEGARGTAYSGDFSVLADAYRRVAEAEGRGIPEETRDDYADMDAMFVDEASAEAR